ncbi:MAG: pyruvate formate lyase family protein, partial [Enterococcus sp.]
MQEKFKDHENCGHGQFTEEDMRLREEITDQYNALKRIKEMAAAYGFDISRPAENAKEAVQWTYFGYLAAIKEQNGAAMSIGRVSTFLDIYIQRDIENGTLTEVEAQELIDHLVMKLRMVKFARIPSYNELFSGDPVWATLSIAGMGMDGRTLVTKNDFRFLHTLENMGPSPEPNLTVLYSSRLPEGFKDYAAKISIDTSSIQYENDDVMRPVWLDDYAICCCVSATQTGKEMQFFGARANLAKALLYAINGGVDEKSKTQVGPDYRPIESDDALDFEEVMAKYDDMLEWLAGMYVNTLNAIHYMHDKYYYEAAELALMDTNLKRTFATGIAGFSHVVDSLAAIKYAKVFPLRDEDGIVTDFKIDGEFPKYGNDDARADDIAVWLLKKFMEKLEHYHTYRNSEPTTSILTITSNVVYGKATGTMPDGRKAGEPLSPGANPSYGAEQNGLLASLNSLTKLPYEYALDGISNTQSINPDALGHDEDERIENLTSVLDGYFNQGAHHLNVNVFGKEKLVDAMEHPEKEEYANFTIRVSGYAVKFIDLTREQQEDVISRTFHSKM